MYVGTQRLSHLLASDIGNCMQGQAVVKLIVIQKVLPYAVDHKVKEFVLLVQEEGNGKISYLFLGVFGRRNQIDGLEVSEVDIPSQNIYVKELRRLEPILREE